MDPATPPHPTDDPDDIAATFVRERSRLGHFIRSRVGDRTDAEDILQDVFSEFVASYLLPEPVEQVSAWLYRVARNRIVDRFRKKKEQPLAYAGDAEDDDDADLRLDLALPSNDGGPEAAYARSALLATLEEALAELPNNQREVFISHEFDGVSFKELAARSGIPLNTLLSRKRYAVLYLRTRLQTIYDELEG